MPGSIATDNQFELTLPDGSKRTYPSGTTGYEVAHSISPGLARAALSITLNGEVRDLGLPIIENGSIRINTWDSDDGKMTFWHSSAHLLAEAVQSLYPHVKFGIGPAIENGFYYDMDFGDVTISTEDLGKIEAKMYELARSKSEFTRKAIPKNDAIAYYEKVGDPYKIDLLKDLEDGTITFYTQGNFTDLCRGPHIPNTEVVKAMKLMSVAGAYWRGDSSNKQLTRIYGISFPKKSMLDEYLNMLE
jgi:threonyl-tRNA synthetase